MLLSFGPSRTPAPTTRNYSCGLFRRGAASSPPRDRRKHFYISHRQRQRRRSRDDTTFKAPCKALPNAWAAPPQPARCGARGGSPETIRFLAAFFGYFLSLVKESNPPEAKNNHALTKKPPRRDIPGAAAHYSQSDTNQSVTSISGCSASTKPTIASQPKISFTCCSSSSRAASTCSLLKSVKPSMGKKM